LGTGSRLNCAPKGRSAALDKFDRDWKAQLYGRTDALWQLRCRQDVLVARLRDALRQLDLEVKMKTWKVCMVDESGCPTSQKLQASSRDQACALVLEGLRQQGLQAAVQVLWAEEVLPEDSSDTDV
jgi:hypothetical protein